MDQKWAVPNERSISMRYTAKPYQKTGIQFIIDRPQCAVFADPGGGKTGMTLAAFSILRARGLAKRMLIIAPRLVCYNTWPAELKKWEQFNGLKCRIFHGEEKAQAIFQEFIDPKADIVLLNPEAVSYFFSFFTDAILKSHPNPWDFLAVDESSKFKNPGAVRFKCIKKHLDLFKRRLILTGTPSPNSLADLWAQIYMLDKGIALGRNITTFRAHFMESVQFPGAKFKIYKMKRGADQQIFDRIKHLAIRFDASMFADLPPIVYNQIEIDLPEKARRYYDDIEQQMFAELDNVETLIDSAAGKYLTCRQIANGRHYGEEKSQVVKVHSEKIEAVKNTIDELQGKPCLIAYFFKHDLDQIREAFPKIPNIGADSSTKEINANLEKWNKGEISVLAVHPGSMAHGLNMQSGGNDIVWFSLTDSLEQWQQLNARLHRPGAVGQVRIHIPIVKKSVDEAIYNRLANKAENQKSLLDSLRDYRAAGSHVPKI